LADLGSTNGTLVARGQERIALSDEGAAIALRDGDVIELGAGPDACHLRVHWTDDAAEAQLMSIKSVADVAVATTALQDDPVTLRALYGAQSKIGRAAGLSAVLDALAEAVFDLV